LTSFREDTANYMPGGW